jgi:hypothetical protein
MGYKAWFCVLSLAGFAGSNSARSIDVFSCDFCVFQVEVFASAWLVDNEGALAH